MKRLFTIATLAAAFAAIAIEAWAAPPARGKKPTASISASAAEVESGEKVTITWSTTNAKRVTLIHAWPDESASSGFDYKSETVASSGSKTFTLTKPTLFRISAKRMFKKVSDDVEVNVVGYDDGTDDADDEDGGDDDEDPPAPPNADCTLSVVAFGNAFEIDDKLSFAARDEELIKYVKACGGSWAMVSEGTLAEDHPKSLDAWWKLYEASPAAGKTAIATYQKEAGVVINIQWDAVTADTDLLELLKSRTPQPDDGTVVIDGKRRHLGFKKTPAKRRGIINGVQAKLVSEILAPKTVADIPADGIDLRHALPFLWNQGSYGSCVSQAVGTAGTSANYIQFGPNNFTELSPNFLATRADGWDGAWAEQVISVLLSEGCVTLDEQPNYSHRLPTNWKKKAAKHRAIGVYRQPSKDAQGYIIAALSRGYPVVAAIGVGSGFSPDSNGCISCRRGCSSYVNHEIIICGVKVVDSQVWWLMKNSWGTWGTIGNGSAWLVEDSSSRSWIADDMDLDLWVIVRMTASEDYQFDDPTANVEFGGRKPVLNPKITASATQIKSGDQVIVMWTNTTDTVLCTLNGQAVAINGQKEVYPDKDATYSIIAYDKKGNTQVSWVRVEVVAAKKASRPTCTNNGERESRTPLIRRFFRRRR